MRIHAARATEDPSRSTLSKPGVNRLSSTAQESLGTVEQKLPSTDVRVLAPNQLVHLQRTIGNHRVGELLGRAYGMASSVGSSVHPEQEPARPRLRAKHRSSQIPSFASAPVGLRAKLTVGPPEDRYEQEADRVAGQVMRMPDPHAHRKTADGMRLMAHELTHVVQQEAAGWKPVQAKPAIDQPGSPSPSPSGGQTGSTLPFREATELLDCIRIMGEANRDYCRAVVLGEKPEVVEEAWGRVQTSGPRLLDGREPSYQVWFNHLLPPVPTGVKQLWQVVESTHTLLTDQCELKTETDFRIDVVDIGSRTRINDSWGWIRRDNPCFAMEESKATVGFDDQTSNLAQQTNVKASKQLAEDTLGKMTGPKGTYSGVYTFVKSANCRDCSAKLKEIQEQNRARNGEALTIEGIGSWRS